LLLTDIVNELSNFTASRSAKTKARLKQKHRRELYEYVHETHGCRAPLKPITHNPLVPTYGVYVGLTALQLISLGLVRKHIDKRKTQRFNFTPAYFFRPGA
jgi:hypothetical protein